MVHKNSKLALRWKIGTTPTFKLRVVPPFCAHLPTGRSSTCGDRCDRRSDKTKCSSNIVDGWVLTKCCTQARLAATSLPTSVTNSSCSPSMGQSTCVMLYMQACHQSRVPRCTSFPHLARGLRIPVRSAAARFPPLPSLPFRERSPHFQSKASRSQGNQR